MLKIYNTLTRQKEEFHPQQAGIVNMYVCGPTVYNYIHIGNARSVVAFDTVRRYLEFSGYQVNYVSNFTDVDDKMIKAAKEQGITVPELAYKYIQAYMEDTAALNVEPATTHPRATENIDGIISFIEDLIEKGYAYQSGGDVYYRARKFAHYGQLSGQSLDDLEVGASEHVSTEEVAKKEDPLDFALWKAAKPGEIKWDSPWGAGRPGWHIECSVMSTKYLGDTLDIHAGGQDLEFPHHENEIAQSEAKTGHRFVNYWMHNGFVTIGRDNEKMSKSLGNTAQVTEVTKAYSPRAVRYFLLAPHYRSMIEFSPSDEDTKGSLDEATKAIERIDSFLDRARDLVGEEAAPSKDLPAAFVTAMDDDLGTPQAVAALFSEITEGNKSVSAHDVDATREHMARARAMLAVFGLDPQAPEWADTAGNEARLEPVVDGLVQAMLDQRAEARSRKDWATADAIRDTLTNLGLTIEDTPTGAHWSLS